MMINTNTFRIGGLAVALVALLASPALAHHHHDDQHQQAASADAISGDEVDDNEEFDVMLRSIDVLPDRQQLEQQWPNALKRLVAIARDADNRTDFERWRAASLLANFDEDQAREVLTELTDDPESRIRAQAYYTLGTNFLEPGDDNLMAVLEQGLEDASESVRIRVVRSFGWTDHPRAHDLLEQIVADEDADDLRVHAERALERHAK